MNNIEFMMCVDCVKWSDAWFNIRHKDLLVEQYDKKTKTTRMISPLVHITNEGKMSDKRGYQTNKIGRRRGFLDYLYPVPMHGFGGLYIEVKRPDEKITERNQQNWYEFLKRFNRCEVVDSVRGFQTVVEDYFGR